MEAITALLLQSNVTLTSHLMPLAGEAVYFITNVIQKTSTSQLQLVVLIGSNHKKVIKLKIF